MSIILSPTGVLFIPGLIHDFAYRYDYLWAVNSKGEPVKYKTNPGQVIENAMHSKLFRIVCQIRWLAKKTEKHPLNLRKKSWNLWMRVTIYGNLKKVTKPRKTKKPTEMT